MSKPATCSICRRALYVLAGSGVLVCRTCDWAELNRGPTAPVRDQGAK